MRAEAESRGVSAAPEAPERMLRRLRLGARPDRTLSSSRVAMSVRSAASDRLAVIERPVAAVIPCGLNPIRPDDAAGLREGSQPAWAETPLYRGGLVARRTSPCSPYSVSTPAPKSPIRPRRHRRWAAPPASLLSRCCRVHDRDRSTSGITLVRAGVRCHNRRNFILARMIGRDAGTRAALDGVSVGG